MNNDEERPLTIEAGGLRVVFLKDGKFKDDDGIEHAVKAGIKVSGVGKYPLKFSALQLATLVNICRDQDAKSWLTDRLKYEKEKMVGVEF